MSLGIWDPVQHQLIGGCIGFAIGLAVNQIRLTNKMAAQAIRMAEAASREAHEVSESIHPHDHRGEPQTEFGVDDANLDGDEEPNERRVSVLTNDERKKNQAAIRITVVLSLVISLFAGWYINKANDRLDAVTVAQHNLDKQQDAFQAELDDFAEQQADFKAEVACQRQNFVTTIEALKARSQFAEDQARATIAADQAFLTFLDIIFDPTIPAADKLAAKTDYVNAIHAKDRVLRDQLAIRETHNYPTQEEIESCGK